MRDSQTPTKENPRSSELANRRSKESQSKKSQKIATKKSLNCAFTSVSEDVSSENSKEPIDFSPISEVLDSNFESEESFSPALSVSSEALALCDLTTSSTIASKKDESGKVSVVRYGINESGGSSSCPVEADIVASLLRQARSQVLNSADVDVSSKKLLDSLIKTVIEEIYGFPEERNCLSELISMKTCVVLSCFLLWIFAVLVFFFFSLGARSSFSERPPT